MDTTNSPDVTEVSPKGLQILADLERMRDKQTQHTFAEQIRHSVYSEVVERVSDLLKGCTCRPGSMLQGWGCRVEGHDPAYREYE